MTLYIKNMVCNRCIMVVDTDFRKLGLHPVNVQLGEVEIEETLDDASKSGLRSTLLGLGFDLIDDKKSRIIEKIKNLIIDLVHHQESDQEKKLSAMLTEALNYDYNYLSNLFSAVEGITIEKYFIAQKIERVKELLVYDELTLSEIAYRLNYSSVAYLSNQFKKITGLTPSHFKRIGIEKRKALDKV